MKTRISVGGEAIIGCPMIWHTDRFFGSAHVGKPPLGHTKNRSPLFEHITYPRERKPRLLGLRQGWYDKMPFLFSIEVQVAVAPTCAKVKMQMRARRHCGCQDQILIFRAGL